MRIICLLLIALLASASAKRAKKRPNIVVVMADDMGFDDVSFHGSKQHITPNIDAIAYHGLILQNLYGATMCTPSRSAFMTGKYPIHTGTQHYVISNEAPWGMPTNITTIAQIFREAGYSTNLVGKWHLGHGYKDMLPTNRGFDSHYGYLGGYVDYFQRRAIMPIENASMGYDFRRDFELECADRGVYLTDLFTREAESIIDAHDKKKPLFLVVNHLAPHAANDDEPLQAPKEIIDKFAYIKDPKRRIYAAMIDKLDESIGHVITALDKKEILDNTIVVFYADNGAPSIGLYSNTGSNWPMRGQKNTPWEGGLRVAGAIWSPLLRRRNRIFKQNIYVADWLPTLASAANIQLSPDLDLDGLDLWNQLSNAKSETFDRDIVHMLDDIWGVTSYLSGKFKYINGTTLNGYASNVLTHRQPEVDPRNVEYANSIKNSATGKILAKHQKIPLTAYKIKNLRSSAQLHCNDPEKKIDCNPLVEECLYRIDLDPCEQVNLAGQEEYAEILVEMREAVESYRSTAVPSAVLPGLPEGDPSRHNCAWTYFMDEPPTTNIHDCGYHGLPC